MKKTSTLLFLVLSMSVASAQDTLTPAQMREDFAYMMEQYERIHPNPTWSLGEERYNELKQQTLVQLDRPMTQLDFWRIIARWNQHFDGHTHVGWPTISPMPAGMIAFPPKSIVQYRDNKFFFSAYEAMPDSLQGCEILAINGHPTAEIIDSIMPYVSHESAAHTNNVILRSLYWFYQAFYGYSSQMEFLYRTTNAENTVLLDRRTLYTWLVQVGDMGEIGGVGVRDCPWHFSIFPEQGVALFEFNTCGPNDKFEQFDSVVAACIDSVNHYGINHLFVDISYNGGGNDEFCRRLLCHIDGLPDTVAVMDVTDTEMGTVAAPEEKRMTMTFTPKSPLYGGKLYFIQSQFTYSAAILLANLAKQYRLGPVIGEETGGLTTTFTRHNPISLPHSGLTFYCSDKQFRHIGTTGFSGVLPDIPMEIGYKYLFRSFTAEELQQILVDHRQYSLNLRIGGDTLRVSGFYLNPYNNTAYAEAPIKVDTTYSLPLADYRTSDGAIVLRREGNWYPHRNGELLTAKVSIEADDYYIIGGSETTPSFDIHLVLLPKDKYACKVIDTPTRPFHFYRLASDTTQYPEAYYREFVDSYNFYCSFFGDSLSSKPMNIVEIGDPQFVMCQSLRDMIIFGHYFYDVYTMIPDFSWIPHEVAHQWWGDGIFFEYRDYALSESLNEYIKLQYLKSRGRGYKEQLDYYKAMMERAEKTLPIADIHSVESQDESIAIYHAAPYRLASEDASTVNTTLQQLYSKYKHTVVSREVFLQECQALQFWLTSK